MNAKSRPGSSALPWVAGGLLMAWGYLWLVAGARGIAVHLLLAAAFALLVAWGLMRAV